MRYYFNLTLLLLLLTPLLATAQNAPIKIGDEIDVSLSTEHPYAVPNNGNVVFEQNFHSPDASYIKIHFKNFQLADGDYVSITGENSDQEIIYGGGGKRINNGTETLSDFWSLSLFSDQATLKLYSTSSKADYGFDIDKVAYGFPEQQIQQNINESLCGSDDKEHIACYDGTVLYDKAKAVCRLVLGGSGLCTGWLIGTEGHVMTNNHCVGSQNEANNVEFQFNYQFNNCNGSGTASTDQVAQSSNLLCTDGTLDYTLLELPVNATATYGFLSMRSSGPVVGERIYIAQHPGGNRKRISVNDDQSPSGLAEVITSTGGGNNTRVGYYADTEGGSSGSPVLGYGDHLVVALHNTGGCLNGGNRVDAIINHMGTCLPPGGIDNPGGLVVASFESNTVKSCDGNVQFDNNSFNADNYFWNFDDGNTSTLESPAHQYSSSGNFDVRLIVQDLNGNADTTFKQVNVTLVDPPVASDDTLCGSGSVQLTATSPNGAPVYWYSSPVGGSLLFSGNTFTTPSLSNSTTYYVGTEENITAQNVGPFDNGIDGGQMFTANDLWGCLFTVEKPLTLNSVKVFAGSAGNRNIELLQNGNIIDSETINIPVGESRINLNFAIDPGNQYLLKITGNTVDLFRNDGGANYPYSIPGLISITGNNTTSGTADDYYYYFYDWEVKETACKSSRTPVQVLVTSPFNITGNTTDADCQGNTSGAIDLTLSPLPPTVSYEWSNGETTQDLSNLQSGSYTITVTSGDCEVIETFVIGNSGQTPQINSTIQDESCQGAEDGAISLNITNAPSNPNINWSNGETDPILSNLSPGTYSVTVGSGTNCQSTEVLLVNPGGVAPSIGADVQNITCNGESNGAVALLLSDTVAPVSIEWFNGSSNLEFDNLAAGNYSVTVKNGNNCTSTQSFNISEPNPITITTESDTTQINNCNALVWVIPSGGTAPYTFQWSDPQLQTNDTATGLCPGTYSVRITDANNCGVMNQVEVGAAVNTSISSTEPWDNIRFYPVPASDYLLVEFPALLLNEEIQISLYNVVGKEMIKHRFVEGKQVQQMDLNTLVPGTYLLHIQMDEKMMWEKVVVL